MSILSDAELFINELIKDYYCRYFIPSSGRCSSICYRNLRLLHLFLASVLVHVTVGGK